MVFISDITRLYSDRARKMRKSVIRELLKVTQDPEIISFAGGLPNPNSFPIDDLKDVVTKIMDNQGKTALQYGTTQGLPELREVIAQRAKKDGINTNADEIIIMSGSQQALDTIGKIFLNPGDYALCGLPTYLGGINAFKSYEANLEGIPLDNNGMMVDVLEDKIKDLLRAEIAPKFIYTVPTFQNPAGVLMPESRRKKLIDIAVSNVKHMSNNSTYQKSNNNIKDRIGFQNMEVKINKLQNDLNATNENMKEFKSTTEKQLNLMSSSIENMLNILSK